MYDSATDPLGIGLRGRAADRRQQFELANVGHNMGPLHDPQWDAFFQAMDEAGIDKAAAGGSFQPQRGVSTFDPQYQASAPFEAGPSRQMNAPVHPALEALRRYTSRRG